MTSIKKKFYKTIHGIKIYLVDDGDVRNKLDVNFTLGSHFKGDKYIPKGQVWIANRLKGIDRTALIEHELVELAYMLRGMKYRTAHALATKAEKKVRRKK